MAIRTIFTMAEDCALGVRQGWVEFIRDYGSLCRTLLTHYFPGLIPEINLHLRTVFVRANADSNAWFRSQHFANQREFDMNFRSFAIVYGREFDRIPLPELSSDILGRAQENLTLIQRQVFWVVLRGWTANETSAILMNATATAQESNTLAEERLASVLSVNSSADRRATARAAMQIAEGARTPDCLSAKTMDNIINGQIAWRDRQASEDHMLGCDHCLNAFTSFQEMIWLQKSAEPLQKEEIDRYLNGLHLQAPKGFWSRLLAG